MGGDQSLDHKSKALPDNAFALILRSIHRLRHNEVYQHYFARDKTQPNIEIRTREYVDRIILELDSNGTLRAAGVQMQTASGHAITAKAREEVIITAGTYGSPAILLRSGVGPKEELRQHGIKTILNLPSVGKNLMDHLVMLSFYEVSKPGVTNDHLIWHKGARERTAQEYQKPHTGFFSQFSFGVFAYARLDERLKDSELWRNAYRANGRDPMGTLPSQPHVEFWNTECYSPKYMYRDFPPDGRFAFALATEFFAPRSRGEVTLESADPTKNPIVQHNYLSDPLDMLLFSEGCRFANEIVLEGLGTKDIIIGSWPAEHGHHSYKTREEWQQAIRQRADTCYHPAGSCKMGRKNDHAAVVDAELLVRGISNVRVADASIMPTLISGHPQMAVFAIGEKVSDLIRESRKT
ncbi:GMC oxidoreductase [Glonium stellatum]|uniref:GMC oxidoreductase n=1 Tax=Glonium stellatum TaxID=574774 RepID=A0A8E2F2A8_9PEZI|nr:GMC oxidoreductase [Glonium stellatum]